ncbi:MAG: TfoX/Sxy family protein [Acholeplasmatales bacterium]|nr:TfoX/Sxy family protein [Acholeplasmatales bacterium]
MPSDNNYLEYVLDLLSEVDDISYKKMMGEYLLYSDGILFGGIYDNRFLLKKTKSLSSYGLCEETPYLGAKPMYLVDIEDKKEITNLVDSVIKDLHNTLK